MTQGSDLGLQVPQVPQVLQVPQEYIVPVGHINSKLSSVSGYAKSSKVPCNPSINHNLPKGLVIVQELQLKIYQIIYFVNFKGPSVDRYLHAQFTTGPFKPSSEHES